MARLIEGSPVEDARKVHILTVTKADSQRGNRKDFRTCAIALSCKRDFEADEVRVHRTRVYVRIGSKWTRYACSRALNMEICVFDRGGDFQPGDYVLYAPQPSMRLGAARVRKARKSGPRRKRFLPVHVMEGVRARPGGWEEEPK